jgi:hypothetical protein
MLSKLPANLSLSDYVVLLYPNCLTILIQRVISLGCRNDLVTVGASRGFVFFLLFQNSRCKGNEDIRG